MSVDGIMVAVAVSTNSSGVGEIAVGDSILVWVRSAVGGGSVGKVVSSVGRVSPQPVVVSKMISKMRILSWKLAFLSLL